MAGSFFIAAFSAFVSPIVSLEGSLRALMYPSWVRCFLLLPLGNFFLLADKNVPEENLAV
jgi:hypothetical protein